MRGGTSTGSHHRAFGDFLDAAGDRKKIVPLGVACGKIKSVLVLYRKRVNELKNWVAMDRW